MTLDEYIARQCAEYVSVLEQLAPARSHEGVHQAMGTLVEHLRALYRIRRGAFSTQLLERIKKCSVPQANQKTVEPPDDALEGPSASFQVGKRYLSRHGVFKVIGVNPYLNIDPQYYPKRCAPYLVSYLMEEHNRLIEERMREFNVAKAFAESFALLQTTAEAEVADLTAKYHLLIEANHRNFLAKRGMPYPGTQPTKKHYRVTHCYSCRADLHSELYKECSECGWIICSCGACGCGYDQEH